MQSAAVSSSYVAGDASPYDRHLCTHQTIGELDHEPLRCVRVRVSPELYVWPHRAITAAPITPGDLITSDKALLVSDLVSPGNLALVKRGMQMKIVPTGKPALEVT